MNREKLKELLALARRHLFSVICSGVALAALATAALWWMGLEELRSEHEQKSNRNDKMINLRKTGPVLRSDLAAVREFTQRCTDVLEMYVRRYPHLWLWMHRRWREGQQERAEADEKALIFFQTDTAARGS